mgnify:CR=1 FL=1
MGSKPEEETPIEVVGELEDQRSAYTKSFRLNDGTVSTVEYESDVHYKDEDGEWQPIDNSLIFEDAQGNTGAEAEAASLAAEVAEYRYDKLNQLISEKLSQLYNFAIKQKGVNNNGN